MTTRPVDELSEDNELKAKAMAITQTFDKSVDYMREEFPDEGVRNLMTWMWRSIGNKITPSALTPAVDSISFWVEAKQDGLIGMVLIPENWLEMVEKDANMQLGALVFTASQVWDYTEVLKTGNVGVLVDSQGMIARACRWEARYLRQLREWDPEYELNEYQRHVLERFGDQQS